MRPLFSDAPVLQVAPRMPQQPVGSQLAAALSGGRPPLNLPAANFGGGVPLASMMQAMRANQTPTAQAVNAAPGNGQGGMIQPNSQPWDASTAAPPAQPSWLQQQMPNMPGTMGVSNNQAPPLVPGAPPGVPTPGAPGQLGMLGQMFGGMFGGGGMAGAGGMSGGGG